MPSTSQSASAHPRPRSFRAGWRNGLRRLLGESGASFLEYAMLCALVGIAVSIAVAAFGKNLKALFATLSGKVQDVNSQVKGSTP